MQQIQQKLQNFMLQKQHVQVQKIEVENALKEIKNVKKDDGVFEIVGTIMFKKSKDELNASLDEKNELFTLRLSSLDKQINTLTDEAKEIQAKITAEINKKR